MCRMVQRTVRSGGAPQTTASSARRTPGEQCCTTTPWPAGQCVSAHQPSHSQATGWAVVLMSCWHAETPRVVSTCLCSADPAVSTAGLPVPTPPWSQVLQGQRRFRQPNPMDASLCTNQRARRKARAALAHSQTHQSMPAAQVQGLRPRPLSLEPCTEGAASTRAPPACLART